jgi:glycosyltransferase involved in cell wall biosynthesis
MRGSFHTARARAARLSGHLIRRWFPVLTGARLSSRQVETKRVAKLYRLLWCGHAQYALKELHGLKNRHADAKWALARWYAFSGDYKRALDEMNSAKAALADDWGCGHWLLEITILLELGRVGEAEQTLQAALAALGELPEICFIAANVLKAGAGTGQDSIVSDRQRLYWLNKPFAAAGLTALEVAEAKGRLSFSNFATAPVATDPAASQAKISVIMPAYNAAETLPAALRSVLAQSWDNLEVLVIDDASADNTWSILESFSITDRRVKPLRHEKNRGAYGARNTGLRHATGDFVTINDADDWTHPERLAVQAKHLLTTGAAMNTTQSARVHSDLSVRVKLPNCTALHECIGSLMARRVDVAGLGGWDEPRFNADDEFHDRFQKAYGAERNLLYPEVPLTLQLVRGDSLTACPVTGIPTIKYGARRQYREAARHWLEVETSKVGRPPIMTHSERAFPIPTICKTKQTDRMRYDVVYISDFSRSGERSIFTAHMLDAGHRLGLSQAGFHWPSLKAANRRVDRYMRARFHDKVADVIVAGENVDCDAVVIYDPAILIHTPDPLPNVRAGACVVIADRSPRTAYENNRLVPVADYDIDRAIDSARTLFGIEPVVAPVSPMVRRDLAAMSACPQLTKQDWAPLVGRSVIRQSGSVSDIYRLPIIGGYCGPGVWQAKELREVLCADEACEVRIFGNAKIARSPKADWPGNWTLLPKHDLQEFLTALDFCICYPRRDGSGLIGLVPTEAMAAGIPVILPSRVRSLYGEAAIYTDPGGVFRTISEYWRNDWAYQEQVERGRRYIESHCSNGSLAERLSPYVRALSSRTAGEVDYNRLREPPGISMDQRF